MDRKSRSSRLAEDDLDEEMKLWSEICELLVKLEGVQKDEGVVINTINKTQSSIDIEKGISSLIHQKLKDNYRRGIDLTATESKLIQETVEKLAQLVTLKGGENNQPKRRKSNARKSKIFSSGTKVAANQSKDKNDEWILAIVIQYHHDKNKYTVEDVDQDEFGQKQRYTLPPRYVIEVQNPDDARSAVEISPNQEVLALYPGTTCFYKATVVASPNKSKDIKNYRVQFEDDNNQVRQIKPEHVLEMPKPK